MRPQIICIGLTMLIGIGALNCSNPKVFHSSVSGSVRKISSWTIRPGDQPSISDELDKAMQPVVTYSKHEEQENQIVFIEQVKTDLANKYNFHFSPTHSENGTITVSITRLPRTKYMPVKVKGDPRDKNAKDEDPFLPPPVGSTVNPLKDRITNVTIHILDVNGMLATEIRIEGRNIKAKFVAKVVHRIITRGKY